MRQSARRRQRSLGDLASRLYPSRRASSSSPLRSCSTSTGAFGGVNSRDAEADAVQACAGEDEQGLAVVVPESEVRGLLGAFDRSEVFAPPAKRLVQRARRLLPGQRQAGCDAGHWLSNVLPTGRGLFAFNTIEEAAVAVDAINAVLNGSMAGKFTPNQAKLINQSAIRPPFRARLSWRSGFRSVFTVM
jgi:hypothetical protein